MRHQIALYLIAVCLSHFFSVPAIPCTLLKPVKT
jgi:hypothetical protein